MIIHLDATIVALIAAIMSTFNVIITVAVSAWLGRRGQLRGWKRDLLYPATRSFLISSERHISMLYKTRNADADDLGQLKEQCSDCLRDMETAEVELRLLPAVDLATAAGQLLTAHYKLNNKRFHMKSFDFSFNEFVNVHTHSMAALRIARVEMGLKNTRGLIHAIQLAASLRQSADKDGR